MDRTEAKFRGSPAASGIDQGMDVLALRFLNQQDISQDEFEAVAIKLAEQAAREAGIEVRDIVYEPQFGRIVINKDEPIDATVEADFDSDKNEVIIRCHLSERFSTDRNIEINNKYTHIASPAILGEHQEYIRQRDEADRLRWEEDERRLRTLTEKLNQYAPTHTAVKLSNEEWTVSGMADYCGKPINPDDYWSISDEGDAWKVLVFKKSVTSFNIYDAYEFPK